MISVNQSNSHTDSADLNLLTLIIFSILTIQVHPPKTWRDLQKGKWKREGYKKLFLGWVSILKNLKKKTKTTLCYYPVATYTEHP